MDIPLRKQAQEHFRSSSYPSSFMSTVERIRSALPGEHSKSDTSSPPPSAHSSPGLGSQSLPRHLADKLFKKTISRSSSVELLGFSLSSESRPKTPSSPRPWTSSPKKRSPVPEEQTEGWHRTRLRVARAVSPLVDIAGDVAYEVLLNGAELLEFAPIAGLDGAARLLLGIWDSLQQVDSNRLACLRLTERCADILIAIHEEVSRAGKVVVAVLAEPMENLEHAFEKIQTMLRNQIHQPFWRRYLKRDDILNEIADCNTFLQDALGHFDRSIQLKMLMSSTWPVDRFEASELGLLDREFIEKELRAMQLAYKGPLPSLPSWTITKFEIDLGELIGRGFFSTVYRGSWGGRSVAIKVLEVHTSKELFTNEVNVWKTLDHPNLLELYGASSAEGPMPWFLVSPFMKHGSVTDYLKRTDWEIQRYRESGGMVSAASTMKERVDFLRMMHDIANGMRYLHERGVYHGDLKVANVLLADDLRCVVSDFGQSKWKADVRHGNTLPNHALRWQAPELMGGHGLLSKKIDVYAFAMCCVEILTMGSIPWPTMNDEAVRQHVLDEEGRPPYPEKQAHALGVQELLHASWHQSPSERPSFQKLVPLLQAAREKVLDSASPLLPSPKIVISQTISTSDLFGSPLQRNVAKPDDANLSEDPLSPRAEYSTPLVTVLQQPESDAELPSDDESEDTHSLLETLLLFGDDTDTHRPSSVNDAETIKDRRQDLEDQLEFTYRVCLSHEFPRSLNVPLWTPCDVELGDVGYLSRDGQFMKLFNSIDPERTSGGQMKGIRGISSFGRVSVARRQERETNLVRKGFKAFSKLISPVEGRSPSDSVRRRHTFPLTGERVAFLCAEKTVHAYIEDSRACKLWFRAYREQILDVFGAERGLLKENLMLVVETLTAPHFALFVNHGHLDDEAHFDVFSSPDQGRPWGVFTLPQGEDEVSRPLRSSKISNFGDPSKTILIARLRFQPDVEEPTLLF
ncbi:putative protein tyrosine kinase [Lyophyllum shimeji]|uniref:Protein kinase domain-containing protein n=1 Tax=Lyophyllum shimeji TaxID=47721 RepID=A0A9P3PRF3_LYOSH|nr:putative protein tyrosine kinase [Lyophyllum shimeji]